MRVRTATASAARSRPACWPRRHAPLPTGPARVLVQGVPALAAAVGSCRVLSAVLTIEAIEVHRQEAGIDTRIDALGTEAPLPRRTHRKVQRQQMLIGG